MVIFGCICWNSSIALMVRLWRSCEPHQAKRISIFGCDCAAAAVGWAAAGAAVAPPVVCGGGAGALGELHAATTRATTASRLCQAKTDVGRMPVTSLEPGMKTFSVDRTQFIS